MTLPEKVAAVEKLFRELDGEISQFQSSTSLHCKWGCGKCCFKPDVEATALEFLPFAYALYQQNRALDWLDQLKQSDSPVCHVLNPTRPGTGLCTEYPHRGLICRLFGYSARTNKYGKYELVTCQVIKTEQADAFQQAEEKIGGGLAVPVMNEYYMQLLAIDAGLATVFYPINGAIRQAIETVLHYFAYRNEEELPTGRS